MKVELDNFALTSIEVKNKKVYFKGKTVVEQGIDSVPVTDGFNNNSSKEPVKEFKDKLASLAKYAVDVLEDVDLHFASITDYITGTFNNEEYISHITSLYCVTGVKLTTVSKSLALEISGFRTTVKCQIVPFCTHAISMSDTTYGWEADLENDWHELKGMMYEYIYLNKHANDGGALPIV